MKLTIKKKIAVLRRAKELLAPPGAWIKGSYKNFRANADGTEAPTFCLIGAVNEAYREIAGKYVESGTHAIVDAISLTTHVQKKTGRDTIYDWNDLRRTRKKDVLGVLDEYIEILEKS